MRGKMFNSAKTVSAGKVVTGLLLGSVLGATVGWLTAPGTGEELRRRLAGDRKSWREKVKTAEGNVESQARQLAAAVSPGVQAASDTATAPRKRVTPATS